MSNATCLLALPEFEVTDVYEFVDEAVIQVVMPRREVACTRCGVIALHRVHDRVWHRVRDLPAGGRPVVLLWDKRVLTCIEGCGTFRERSSAVPPRACLTARARVEAVRLVSGENRSVASVAAMFGVSWDTVMRAVRDDAERVAAEHDGQRVVAFGLDETVMNPSRSHTRRRYVTVFVDLDRHRVIDVVEGRHAAAVTDWLATQDPAWRAQVATVALDPHAGYRTAVTDDEVGFDNAQLVADCFHVVKLANAAIDDVRRRVQQQTTGHRGHKQDPLYRIRRALLAGIERLDDNAIASVRVALDAGDPYDEVGCAWLAKELVRSIFDTTCPDIAARRLVAFYEWVAEVEVPELVRLATTLSRWQDEILAYHHTGGVTSARVEAVNLDVKNIKRVARGFTNFANYRARIISRLSQTWQAPTTARLRGPHALALAA
jgi:transposase